MKEWLQLVWRRLVLCGRSRGVRRAGRAVRPGRGPTRPTLSHRSRSGELGGSFGLGGLGTCDIRRCPPRPFPFLEGALFELPAFVRLGGAQLDLVDDVLELLVVAPCS
jgi:hypothetical protein